MPTLNRGLTAHEKEALERVLKFINGEHLGASRTDVKTVVGLMFDAVGAGLELTERLEAANNERDHLKASLVTERQWHAEALGGLRAAQQNRDEWFKAYREMVGLLKKTQDELAHEKGGRLDEAAIREACERETGVWPYGRIADAIVETLRTQQVKWEAFVTAESERAEKAEALVAELEAEVSAWRDTPARILYENQRKRAEKAEAERDELEARRKLEEMHNTLAKVGKP